MVKFGFRGKKTFHLFIYLLELFFLKPWHSKNFFFSFLCFSYFQEIMVSVSLFSGLFSLNYS